MLNAILEPINHLSNTEIKILEEFLEERLHNEHTEDYIIHLSFTA